MPRRALGGLSLMLLANYVLSIGGSYYLGRFLDGAASVVGAGRTAEVIAGRGRRLRAVRTIAPEPT